MNRTGALILAAGLSSRMGEFKPLLKLGGETVINRVVKALKSGGVDETAVVTGHSRRLLSAQLSGLGVEELENEDFAKGMFSSVRRGIEYFSGRDVGGVLLTPVDCPLIPAGLVRLMLCEAQSSPGEFIVPCYRGKKGHPLWIPRSLFGEILESDGSDGLRGVTEKRAPRLVETPFEEAVMNMNTPEAFKRIENYLSRGSASLPELVKGRRLILIRHGQQEQRGEKIFLGRHDPPLSEQGRAQAERLASELKNAGITAKAVYTSPLKRALQSAEYLADALGLPIKSVEDFAEMSLGAWDGRTISEIRERFPEQYERRGRNLARFKPDGQSENFYDLNYRAVNSLKEILVTDSSRDIVIVAHRGVITVLRAELCGLELESEIRNEGIGTGELLTLEF